MSENAEPTQVGISLVSFTTIFCLGSYCLYPNLMPMWKSYELLTNIREHSEKLGFEDDYVLSVQSCSNFRKMVNEYFELEDDFDFVGFVPKGQVCH